MHIIPAEWLMIRISFLDLIIHNPAPGIPDIKSHTMIRMTRTLLLIALLLTAVSRNIQAQYFSSGPVPMCDTSYFTTSVAGIGTLNDPSWGWGFTLMGVCIDITTNHPQTLYITLTSPMGTTLLLSAYNGAGGVNYTSTCFDYYGGAVISTQTAPFTGSWTAQGGQLNVFNGENADGTWTITVIDTACNGGGGGGGGGWTDGYFNGAFGSGMTFVPNIPPCMGWIPSNSVTICSGEIVDILGYYASSGSGYIYDISLNGSPVPNASAVTIPGSYQVTATDPWTGCFYWATYDITMIPASFLGSDVTISQCGSAPFNLMSLFPVIVSSYSWSHNGNPITNAAAANAVAGGTYELIAINTNGCTDTAVVILNLFSAVSLGADQISSNCTAAPVDLTSLYNVTGLTSSWTFNGNPVLNPASVSVNGDYTLIASSGSCSDTAVVTVSIGQAVTLGADQQISSCTGTVIDLTSLYATGTNTTTWTSGGNPVPDPTQIATSGTYQLIAASTGGCADTADVTVTMITAAALGADQSFTICSNELLDLTSLYNTAGMSVSWTSGGNPVLNPSNVNATGTYTLIASVSGSCADTADVMLNALTAPAVGNDQNIALCPGDAVDLTSLFNIPGLTAAWSMSGIPVVNPSSVNSAGTYTLIAAAANGCTDTADVNITAAMAPVTGPDQQVTLCEGESVDLNTLYVTTGNTVSWIMNGNAVLNSSNITTAGVYDLTVTNSSGCTATAAVTVTVNAKPALGSDATISLCSGGTADLTSMFSLVNLTAVWTESGNAVADASQVNAAGNYQLIAVNADGCIDTAMVYVTVNTGPDLGADISITLCEGTTADLSSFYTTNGLNAIYSFNGTPVTNYTAVYDSGTYVVTVSDVNGCTDEANIFIASMECICLVDFDYTGHCIGKPFSFRLISDSTIINAQWTFSDPTVSDRFNLSPVVTFNTEDSVLVTLYARLSCGEEIVKKYVKAEDCAAACPVYFPSAFSPNNDVRNDHFNWYAECEPEEFNLVIYDRFGRIVFKTTNPSLSWDGKTSYGYAPAGLYVYHVQYRMPYQDKKSLIQQLTLLR